MALPACCLGAVPAFLRQYRCSLHLPGLPFRPLRPVSGVLNLPFNILFLLHMLFSPLSKQRQVLFFV
jgi:hypothetical protein